MAGLKPTANDVALGLRIGESRRAAGLTQRVVAEALGISAAQLQKYEKGTNRLSATSLPIIARLTRRPVAWFFVGAVVPAEAKPLKKIASRLGVDPSKFEF